MNDKFKIILITLVVCFIVYYILVGNQITFVSKDGFGIGYIIYNKEEYEKKINITEAKKTIQTTR